MTKRHLLVLTLLALSWACRSPVVPEQPLRYPCDPGADASASQCPEGSRCGLEGSCHVLGVAAPYVCASDADCEGGWRCSTEKRCADVSQEALELPSPAGSPRLAPLIPPLFADPEPRLLATTEVELRVGCLGPERVRWEDVPVSVFAAIGAAGSLEIVYRPPNDIPDLSPLLDEEECRAKRGAASVPRLSEVRRLHPPQGVELISLAAVPARIVGVGAEGQLCQVAVDYREPQDWTCSQPGRVPAGQLRTPVVMYRGAPERALVLFDAHTIAVWAGAATEFSVRTSIKLEGDPSPLRLNDVLVLEALTGNLLQLFVSTDEGLFTVAFNGGSKADPENRFHRAEGVYVPPAGGWVTPWVKPEGPWRRVPLHDEMCRLGGLGEWERPDWLGWMGGVPGDGGTLLWSSGSESEVGRNHSLATRATLTLPGAVSPWACEPIPLLAGGGTRAVLDIPAYGKGKKFVWLGELRPESLRLEPVTEETVRVDGLLSTDAGEFRAISGVTGYNQALNAEVTGRLGSAIRSAFLRVPPLHSRHSPSRALAVNALGQAWAWTPPLIGEPTQRKPLGPTLVAPEVMRHGTGFALYSPEISVGGAVLEPANALVFQSEQAFDFSENLGVDDVLHVSSHVANATLRVLREPSGLIRHAWLHPGAQPGKERILASFARFSELRPPFTSTVTPTRGEGLHLLTVAGDTLFASDLGAGLAAQELVLQGADLDAANQAHVALVPFPNAAITSIAPLPARNEAFAGGYLVAGHRVFRYRASTPYVWSSEQVDLADLTAWETWTDGAKARVGDTMGRILSLPSLVPLSAPLPEAAGAILDYEQVCGQIWALAVNGLYRLEAPSSGGALARWVQTIPAVPLPGHGADFRGSSLKGHLQTLLFIDPAGRPFRVEGLGCQP